MALGDLVRGKVVLERLDDLRDRRVEREVLLTACARLEPTILGSGGGSGRCRFRRLCESRVG